MRYATLPIKAVYNSNYELHTQEQEYLLQLEFQLSVGKGACMRMELVKSCMVERLRIFSGALH